MPIGFVMCFIPSHLYQHMGHLSISGLPSKRYHMSQSSLQIAPCFPSALSSTCSLLDHFLACYDLEVQVTLLFALLPYASHQRVTICQAMLATRTSAIALGRAVGSMMFCVASVYFLSLYCQHRRDFDEEKLVCTCRCSQEEP